MSQKLIKRLKSLGWRTGGMVSVAVLSFMVTNATELQLPSYLVVFAGLLVGEITKLLNTK